MRGLEHKVAIVTGASRGAGRGIALSLGAAGATVYVTGRSTSSSSSRPELPGTIDETAADVTARGGHGIAVRVDHTVDDDVVALFARVQQEQGRLDLLVNNAWGGYESYDESGFTLPFWQQPVQRWDNMFTAGARAHFTASRLAAPLMIAQRSGLIINTTFWDRDTYFQPLPYYLAKSTINRMAYGMAIELRAYGVAALALSPGWMRTEAVLSAYGVDEQGWQSVADLAGTESPEYIGRAVVALARDPNVLEKSGRTLAVGDLAGEYGFADVDGRQVPAFHIPSERLLD